MKQEIEAPNLKADRVVNGLANGATHEAPNDVTTNGHPKDVFQIPTDSPLIHTVFDAAKKEGEGMAEFTLREWMEKVENGEIQPTRNSHDTLYQAVTSSGEIFLPSGYKDYPSMSNREDEYAVLGLHRTKEVLMRYIKMGKGSGGKNLFLVFVGASGGGKTAMTDVLKRLYESHTTTHPIYAIKDCKNRCDPTALLDNIPKLGKQERKELKEKGLDTTCKLCPDCKGKLKKTKYDLDQFSVVTTSLASGSGITTLEPDDTRSELARRSIVKKRQRGAHRGLLIMTELKKHGDFFHLFNDFLSGRIMHDKKGREFEVDCVAAASLTDDEWREIENDRSLVSFRKRVQIIRVPFILTVSDESKLYREKFLKDSERSVYATWGKAGFGDGRVHVSDMTLRTIAEVAVQTRLAQDGGITLAQKADLYDGKSVEGFTQSDVKKMQGDGEKNKEGFMGIAPRDMKMFLADMLTDVETCLDPLQALVAMEKSPYAKESPGTYGEMLFSAKILSARQKYEREMAQMVLRAFRPDFEEACKTQLDTYIDTIELYARKQKAKDPTTEEMIEPSEKSMREIEEKAGVSGLAKKTFREEVLIKIIGLTRKGEEVTVERLDELGLGGLKKAIEEVAFGEKGRPEEVLKKLGDTLSQGQESHFNDPTKRALMLAKVDDDTRAKLTRAAEQLTKGHGCCPGCAWKQMAYLAKISNY